MTDHESDHTELRSRTIFFLPLCGEGHSFIAIDHAYEPEGAASCDECGEPAHDPGFGMLTVSDGKESVTVPLEPGQLLMLAERLTRVASLILESEEDTPDMEREAARYAQKDAS